MRHCKGTSGNSGLAAAIIFLLGMGTLLPWNFFITAMNYFTHRLKGTNVTEHADPDPYMFGNLSVLLAQLPLLLFTLLNSFLYQHIAERVRIAGSMIIILLLFILTTLIVKIEMTQDRFFSITMATIWFINMFGAVLQGSLFGLVSKQSPKLNSLFMSGQAVAGIFSGLAMLLSNIMETDPRTSALGYFITPCVATLFTLCCYFILPYVIPEFPAPLYLENGSTDKVETKNEPLTDIRESVILVKVKFNGDGGLDTNGKAVFTESDSEACEKLDEFKPESTEEKSTVPQVFKQIWVMAFCVTCVFAVTLSVFPAITVMTEPKGFFEGKENIFVPLCSFIVFNVMDWIGRYITSHIQWPSKKSYLFPLLVVLRAIFIPALMLCNVQPRTYLPILFNHDAAYVVIMSLFAMSSGYFACLSMCYATQLVKPKDAETAGALMTFFLALGLSLGAGLSFGLKIIL